MLKEIDFDVERTTGKKVKIKEEHYLWLYNRAVTENLNSIKIDKLEGFLKDNLGDIALKGIGRHTIDVAIMVLKELSRDREVHKNFLRDKLNASMCERCQNITPYRTIVYCDACRRDLGL